MHTVYLQERLTGPRGCERPGQEAQPVGEGRSAARTLWRQDPHRPGLRREAARRCESTRVARMPLGHFSRKTSHHATSQGRANSQKGRGGPGRSWARGRSWQAWQRGASRKDGSQALV